MTLRSLCLALLTYVGGVQSVTADEWVLGLGGADLLDKMRKEAVAVLLEVHSDPFHRQSWAEFSWMGTLKLDTTQNHYGGVGVHALAPLGERAFLEASLAVGGYHQGTYIGKEAEDVLFRSSIGGGHRAGKRQPSLPDNRPPSGSQLQEPAPRQRIRFATVHLGVLSRPFSLF